MSDLEEIKKEIVPLLKEAGVSHASIFGSVARGEGKSNDVDVLIDVPKDMSLFGFIGLSHKLEDVLHAKVDLVDVAGIKPRLKPYIMKDQVVIL